MAGGKDALLQAVEGAEDEIEQPVRLMRQHSVTVSDVVIAVAASGTTPFTLACLREAKKRAALDHRHRQQSAARRCWTKPTIRSGSTPAPNRSRARPA